MKQVIIENPVINFPYQEPQKHFHVSNEGITKEAVEERRLSVCQNRMSSGHQQSWRIWPMVQGSMECQV